MVDWWNYWWGRENGRLTVQWHPVPSTCCPALQIWFFICFRTMGTFPCGEKDILMERIIRLTMLFRFWCVESLARSTSATKTTKFIPWSESCLAVLKHRNPGSYFEWEWQQNIGRLKLWMDIWRYQFIISGEIRLAGRGKASVLVNKWSVTG